MYTVLWFHRYQKALADTGPCARQAGPAQAGPAENAPCPSSTGSATVSTLTSKRKKRRHRKKGETIQMEMINWGHSTALIYSWSHALSTAGSSAEAQQTYIDQSQFHLLRNERHCWQRLNAQPRAQEQVEASWGTSGGRCGPLHTLRCGGWAPSSHDESSPCLGRDLGTKAADQGGTDLLKWPVRSAATIRHCSCSAAKSVKGDMKSYQTGSFWKLWISLFVQQSSQCIPAIIIFFLIIFYVPKIRSMQKET